ncbi:MAG: FHA domain-containing protein [Woeseiaceae bacterium]|nr:FHA domain-containing protein [Woeseiaceae bacterium]
MARLILSLDNQVLAEYNMTKERYTIGRLPDNDVRIDNPAVSGHHSLIINILNDSFLEDLNSTNGTYVNGKLIKKHALQHGDVITIGHHQLRFSDQQAPEAEQDEFEKTMVIPAGQQSADQLAKAEAAADEAVAAAADDIADDIRDDIAEAVKLDPEEAAALEDPPPPEPEPEEAPAEEEAAEPAPEPAPAPAPTETAALSETHAGIDPADAPSALPLAKLQVLSGAFAGRELELTKALTTLGRPGVQVAAITRRAEGYYIVHVESGQEGDFPLVNGQPIGAQARKLSDNDVVQLAGVKMGFFAA